MKQFWKWFRGGVVVSLLVLASVPEGAAATPTFAPGETANAKAGATAVSGSLNEKLATPEAMNTNATQPLTSGDKPMATIDGTITGSAQLSQAASSAFLEIFIKPVPSGDLQSVIVSQDLDMNGAFDFTYNAPGPVSGICSNGYVSCDLGSWNNCNYRAWQVDTTGKVRADTVSVSEVSGCYCINNSCGSNLVWNNLGLVLNNLGGGVAGAVIQGNPNFQITQTNADPSGMKVVFFGQDISRNRSLADGTKVTTATVPEAGYYARPGKTPTLDLAAGSQNEVNAQQADSKSYYSTMRGISNNIGTNSAIQPCKINRTLAFSSPTILKTDPYPPGAILREKPVNEYYKIYDHFTSTKDDCRIGKNPPAYPQYHWSPTDGPSIDASIAPPGSTDTGNVDYKYLSCKKKSGTDIGSYDVYKFWVLEMKKLDIAFETITDNCSALASDSNCTLWGERVDGVDVFRNGGATGLVPQPAPQSFVGQLQTYTVVRDWWVKDRSYRCTSSTGPYDLSGAMKRVEVISKSVNDTPNQATTIPYQDSRQGFDPKTKVFDGSWVNEAGSISLPPNDPTTNCVRMCKTKKPVLATDITLSSTASQERADSTGSNPLPAEQQWKFFYKECTASGCPTETGETVMKDCQCLNEFAEATAVIETLNRAGKDIICTDGVKK